MRRGTSVGLAKGSDLSCAFDGPDLAVTLDGSDPGILFNDHTRSGGSLNPRAGYMCRFYDGLVMPN